VRWSDWIVLGALACGSGSGPGASTSVPAAPTALPAADCEASALTWENTGGPVLLGWCAPCHSTGLAADQRQGAPVGVDFDTVDLARPLAPRIVERAITSTDMPPGAPLTDADQLRLADWIACGMP